MISSRKLTKFQNKILNLIVPFIFGFGGLFISQEIIHSPDSRFVIALFSIALPSFITITMLNKYHFSRKEKSVLVGGMILLFTSGILIISKTSINQYYYDTLPEEVRRLSELIGLGSFLLGILSFVVILIRREENIGELAERFKTLAEHISEGYVLSNPQGIIIDVNEQFCRFISITRQEIIGYSVADVVRRFNISAIEQNWLMLSYGISGEYEIELEVNNQKKYFWIHGTPIFDKKGIHRATLATVKDITDLKVLSMKVQKYAEELEIRVNEQTRKLRESEENLKKLIMTMNEGFLLLNIQHQIVMVNECFCKMIDREMEQVVGHYIFEFLESTDLIRLLSLLEITEKDRRKEITFWGPNGKEITTLVSVSIIPSEKIEDTRYSLVVSDLTQQKKMQNELEERTYQLEQLNEELRQYGKNKDAFLSNVSHELRTPISTIQGYIEMLISGSLGPVTDQEKNALNVMLRNIERLLRMVNEMIEFSRIEIKGLQIKKKLFPVKDIITENISFNSPKIIAKQLKLIENYPNKDIYVWADKEKMSQVLGILLDNAIKFTDTEGTIGIHVSVNNEDALEISISDTGIGIPSEYKDKIFEKFFQVDGSPTRKYEGTGIGLAIAKGIVESHNGKINVESTFGVGSTFTIHIPHCVFYDSRTERAEEKNKIGNILIVDIETVLFEVLRKIFISRDKEIRWTKNIYETIRLVNEVEPEIILINTYEKELENIGTIINVIEQHHISENIPILLIVEDNVNITKSFIKSNPENIYFIKKTFSLISLFEIINKIKHGEKVNKMISIEKKDREIRNVIVVYEPESTLREFIGFMMNFYRIPCIILDNFENVISSIFKFSPTSVVIDMDYLNRLDFEKLKEISEEKKKIVLLSNNRLKEEIEEMNLNIIILNKPFLFEELLRLLDIKEEIKAVMN